MKPRAAILSVFLTVLLVVLGWEVAFDINDPTIPLGRELLFTAGSILGIAAFLMQMFSRPEDR